MRSLLPSDYCLSAWCTWSSVTSVTNDSTTLWVHTILQRLSNNIRVHNSCVLTVLTLLFLCFALMFLMSATMCVYKVWREKNTVYMKATKTNKNKQKQTEDCPIGRSAETLTTENQVHRSKFSLATSLGTPARVVVIVSVLSNQPITWHQLNEFRHVDMFKTTSEWGRKLI